MLLEAVTPQGALLSEIQQLSSTTTSTSTTSTSTTSTTTTTSSSSSKGFRAAAQVQDGVQGEGGSGDGCTHQVFKDQLQQTGEGPDCNGGLRGARDQGAGLGEMSRAVKSSKQQEQQQQVSIMQQGLERLSLKEISAAKQQPVPPSSLQDLAEQLGVLAVPTLTGTLPELLQRFEETSTAREVSSKEQGRKAGKQVTYQVRSRTRMRWGSYGSSFVVDDYGSDDNAASDPLFRWKEMRAAAIKRHRNSSGNTGSSSSSSDSSSDSSSSSSGNGGCTRCSILCAPTSEGWVLQEHATQQRYKLITPAFKRVSHAGRLLHPLSVWDAVRNTGASAAELSAGLPPHLKNELQAILDALQEQYSGAWQQLQEVVGVAKSSAEAMQLLVEEMHAIEQQQAREPMQGVITGAYIPTGVPVPATLEAARGYGYVFEVAGSNGGVAREEGRGLESGSDRLQTCMAGLDLEEFVAHKADSLGSESRSSSQTAGQGLLGMVGDGGGIAAGQSGLVGTQGRVQAEAGGNTAGDSALPQNTSISDTTAHNTGSSSRTHRFSKLSSPSSTVPDDLPTLGLVPADDAITAATRTTTTSSSSLSSLALQNPAFRSAVRYVLEHTDSADRIAMPSMYLDHSSYQSDRRHPLFRSLLLACIPPTFDGQLSRYTPSASSKQTYCKGWAKGTTEGRLASLPCYAFVPAFAAGESCSSSSSSSNNNHSSSSSADLAASTPLTSVLPDILMVEVFRRLETKGLDSGRDDDAEDEVDKDKKTSKKHAKRSSYWDEGSNSSSLSLSGTNIAIRIRQI